MDAQPRTASIPPHSSSPERSQAREGRGILGWIPTSTAWWGGLGFLRFHVSLFLTGIPVLFLINLILSSQRLWIDRVGLAWLALLVVHAAIAGIVWAIGFLRDDSDESLVRKSSSQSRSTWIPARPEAPQDADFRVAGRADASDGWGVPGTPDTEGWSSGRAQTGDGTLSNVAPPTGGHVWDGWTAPRPASTSRLGARPAATANLAQPTTTQINAPDPVAPPDSASEERVSWRKVAEAAWLASPDDDSPDKALDGPSAGPRS